MDSRLVLGWHVLVTDSLHTVDVLAAALGEFRAGVVEEACRYREHEPEVELLNRTVSPPRRRRSRRSACR